MYSYKMFLWNPDYSITVSSVYTHSTDKLGSGFNDKDKLNDKISILRKNRMYAYPEEPFYEYYQQINFMMHNFQIMSRES